MPNKEARKAQLIAHITGPRQNAKSAIELASLLGVTTTTIWNYLREIGEYHWDRRGPRNNTAFVWIEKSMPNKTTNVSISDIATMRKLAEKWPDVFEKDDHDIRWNHYILGGMMGGEFLFTEIGPAILVSALQEVMRREDVSLVVVPVVGGYVAKGDSLAWVSMPNDAIGENAIMSLPVSPVHTNPAIAALRCVAEYVS